MTIASVTTDIHIGPFKIPSNGQNMILNNYAHRKNLQIEVVIPEPIMSNELATTQWLHDDFEFTHVILCSVHQLPQKLTKITTLIEKMHSVVFHFALEGLSGNGENFLMVCHEESRMFREAKTIDSSQASWLKLHNLSKLRCFENK